MPANAAGAASVSPPAKKTPGVPEKKYKCQFCSRAFSRSEHRSRHERSHTKERPFKCMKCRSTFVRRDLLLRHDRTVHAKDGGAPLVSEVKKRSGTGKAAGSSAAGAPATANNAKNGGGGSVGPGRPGRPAKPAPPPALDPAMLEQLEAGSDGVDVETAAMLITDLQHQASAAGGGHRRRGSRRDAAALPDGADGAPDGASVDGGGGSSVEGADADPSTPYSPEHTTMFDNGVGYLANANLPLPQLPWDAFMPHSLGYNGTGAGALHPPQVNPLLDRYASGDGLGGAVMPSVDGASLPVSGRDTPNGSAAHANGVAGGATHPGAGGRGLSPFPFLLGPVSPVDYRRSPGPTQQLVAPRVPQVASDDEWAAIVAGVRAADEEGALAAAGAAFAPPASRRAANDFLAAYFALFHHHLPFLHPESFEAAAAHPALLLAVLSVGALYAFDQEQAFVLHVGAKLLVSQFVQNSEDFASRTSPLWTMQALLLNMVFASWSGDAKGLEWACSIKSLLANMVAGNRYELTRRVEARGDRPPTHDEWIEDEGCRRTYYAVYIFFGLLTLTFNHTPALALDELAELALPSSESLWTLPPPAAASDAAEAWPENLAAALIPTVRSAHDSLFQGEAVRYSALATRVMITALFLDVWAHARRSAPLQDVVAEYRLRLALETWEKSLDACAPETLVVPLAAGPGGVGFGGAHGGVGGSALNGGGGVGGAGAGGAPRGGHPLIFNALAVYRNARARLEVDLKGVQEALRYHDPYEVAGAMTRARPAVRRSQEMVRVVEECLDCVEGVALARSAAAAQQQQHNGAANGNHGGVLARTAATSWSVEHPLCGCDLLVILSLWLYRLEHDAEEATEEELAVYGRIRNLLADDDHGGGSGGGGAPGVDADGGAAGGGGTGGASGKMSALVTRLWGQVLEEVVVWGITKLMGEAFRLHSQALSGHDDAVAAAASAASAASGAGSSPAMSAADAPVAEMELDTAVY